jgi:hypothetical protein
MMKTTLSIHRGAVLVVTLIMLSMITFLVMAFVGFSRFERASVEASLVRTEAGHALEIGLVGAQHEVMDLMGRELNHGLVVSRNQDGAGVGMGTFTNQASLVNFSRSLQDSPRVPVFIDRDGDGVQDSFPFFLDLNSAFNADGSRYQQSVTNNLGRLEGGDPDWIGLLQWPGQLHGPTNKFVARYAYLTVPAHKALNIRYHHNNLKRASANLDQFGRLQGIHPREINLAAPLWVLDPDSFPYRNYNPYFRSTDPRFSSYPNPEANNSAFGYAAELNQFGYQIADAMHLSRSSKSYNELLNRNPGQAAVHLRSLSNWLKKSSNLARATSYYQFMETFSSVPLPEEVEKFDVSSIRDEVERGFAFVDNNQPGFPLTFLQSHGLESGDKLEWDGISTGHALPISDPIIFKLIHQNDQMTDDEKLERWVEFFTQGIVRTEVPHRLLVDEMVQIEIGGVGNGLTLLHRNKVNEPWAPVPGLLAVRIIQDSSDSDDTYLKLDFQLRKFKMWGIWNPRSKQWIPRYKINFEKITNPDPRPQLPPEFADATGTLQYRYFPLNLDLIPYYVKVINPVRLTLHRSAELDEGSRVLFQNNLRLNPVNQFRYNQGNGVFTGLGSNARFFYDLDYIRFVIGGNGQIRLESGVDINESDVFILKKFGKVPFQFTLVSAANPSVPIKMAGSGVYTFQVVHRFKHDGLTAIMEKVAGLMLNESIDTTGGAKVDKSGNLMAGPPVQHNLGGQPLEQLNMLNPAVLALGLGGHHEAKGPWHHPKKGIAWDRGARATPAFSGNFTRELERIIQVSANIADLHSGYAGPNLPIAGLELLTCKSKGVDLLPFGEFSRDLSVSARIRQSGGFSGVVLCVRTDQPDPTRFQAYEVRYVKSANNRSAHLQLGVWKNGAAELVATSRELPAVPPSDFYWLKVECEGGRKVKVSFEYGGERFDEVLNYEHSKSLIGQAALLAVVPGGTVMFGDLKPGIMPAALVGYDNWTYPPRTLTYNRADDILPTAWRGVFRRDEKNYIYLTGFQRWKTWAAGRNRMVATSWYQRGAPLVIGVKDRGSVPGQNLAPAITEFSLRTVYDRKQKALFGRLTAEVHAPGRNGIQYGTRFQGVIKGGTYTLVYENERGDKKQATVQDRRNVAFVGVGVPFNAGGGYANVVMKPGKYLGADPSDPRKNFAGMQYPNQSRFMQLTDPGIELDGAVKDPSNLNGYSLIDIRVDSMFIQVEGEVHLKSGDNRTVDYINSRLSLSAPVHFANVDPVVNSQNPAEFASREWLRIAAWNDNTVYSNPPRLPRRPMFAIHNNAYWICKGIVGTKEPPPESNPKWREMIGMGMRKLDISWQVNDPLVNSHGSNFQSMAYVPGGFNRRYRRDGSQEDVPGTPQQRRHWVSRQNRPPLTQTQFQSMQNIYNWRMGVNLALPNDAMRAWVNGGDSAIQDPGVGYSRSANMDWRFPDISRGRMKNVGWLGQVHRGTPWQTLYLKSKVPGQASIILFNNVTGVVTAPNHNIGRGDRMSLIGKCPKEWADLRINPNAVKVDSAGNILSGELEGFAEPLGPNMFKLWPTQSLSAGGVDVLSQLGDAPDIHGLMTQNIAYWQNWAGSAETLPSNDRRLLEVFSVDAGIPVRGRFSVNNDSYVAWSAPLCGLSIPERATKENDGSTQQQARILGANNADLSPKRDQRIDAMDGRWPQIVNGINATRGRKVFTRVTDVLAAPQLSDGSPYLAVAWRNVSTRASGFADELDAERIPQQLLSLLRVDDQPIFETYIFVEKLRPALRLNLAKYNGPAISPDGTILNYEVSGQTVRRVIYEFIGAKEWHRSLKNNHPGYWRDKDGNLQPLPPLRPKILHSSTLQMN